LNRIQHGTQAVTQSVREMTCVNDCILQMERITKRFPGVVALSEVSLACRKGEVHALVGENGAGKSTLVKILSGAYLPDDGQIVFKGREVELDSPRRAQQLGIAIIMQEFNLLPYLTVQENVFLGREPRGWLGFIDTREAAQRSRELLHAMSVDIDVFELVDRLSVAQRQFVEIAKALSLGADLLIMDEPSATLTGHELEYLFRVINGLKERGVTIIYISHRLDEIFGIADRVTVLKDGKYMGTRDVRDVTKSQLIRMMVGREMGEAFPARGTPAGEIVLKVRGLTRKGVLHSVSFEVRAKEIVGLAGLVGSGRTELARAIFGADPIDSGQVELQGKAVEIKRPHDAVEAGIVLVPEDRKLEGLVDILSVRENIGLPNLGLLQRWGFVRSRQEAAHVQEKIQQLDIRTYGPDQLALNLSGGNQQKVVLGKWLVSAPKLIILDEPTRGIDVGAKAEIYRLMRQLAETGAAVLMISSELPEILGMADRILVMHEGRLVAEFEGARATEEEILTAATGGAV